MKRVISAAAVAAALVGCAAPIVPGGDQVRQITADAAGPCQFIKMIQVDGGLFYSSASEARRDMMNKLHNETIKAGGNAFAAKDVIVERGFSLPSAQADAYRCP